MEVIEAYENAQKIINESVENIQINNEKISNLKTTLKNIDEKINELNIELTSARDIRLSIEDEDSDDSYSSNSDNDDILETSDSEDTSDGDSEDIDINSDSEESNSDIDDSDSDDEAIEGFRNDSKENNKWKVRGGKMPKIETNNYPVRDTAFSFMIIWDRDITEKEKEVATTQLQKYIDSKKNIIDDLTITEQKDEIIIVNINDIVQYYDNSILIAVRLKNRIKYLPENITFDSEQSNSYDVLHGTWEKRIIKPTIVMSKRSGKKWLASLNNNGEIVLEKID
jgi:hypothetical protein